MSLMIIVICDEKVLEMIADGFTNYFDFDSKFNLIQLFNQTLDNYSVTFH